MTETIETLNVPVLEKEKALTQQLYARKCAYPNLEDILNSLHKLCERIQESKHHGLTPLIYDLAALIYQSWHAQDIEISASIRDWCMKDFLEVSEIEAQEKMACCAAQSEQVTDGTCNEPVCAGEAA